MIVVMKAGATAEQIEHVVDRVEEFGSWWAPGGGPQTFPPPYLMRYIERAQTRVVSGFTRDSGSGIEARTAARPTGGL